MKTVFTMLSLGKDYSIFNIKLVNELLNKTSHDIIIATDYPEVYKLINSNRIIINKIDLEADNNKREIAGAFNYNLKFYCFKNIPDNYDVVFYLDCDQKLLAWNEDNFKQYVYNHFVNGYTFIGCRTNAVLDYHLNNYYSTGDDLFKHKIKNYNLTLDNISELWKQATMPSEHFFIMQYNKDKIYKFYSVWKDLNTKTQQLIEPEQVWGDAFEIGIAAVEANYKMVESNSGGIKDTFEIEFNGNKYNYDL